MKKHTLMIHLAWALMAAGAWLLGSTRGEPEPGSPTRRHDDTWQTAAPVFVEKVARLDGKAQTAIADVAADTVAWLQPWTGPDGRIAAQGMATAVADALGDPDPVRGMRRFTQLLECLTPENAPAAFEALKLRTGSGRMASVCMTLLCTKWGAQDGAGAMAALKTQDEDEREAAMSGWAGQDAAAAQQWLAALSKDKGDEWRTLQQGLVRGMARSDPAAALEYITTQDQDARRDLVRLVAREQFSRGAPEAARWAADLPDETMRGSALEAIARQYMQVDPRSGATWAAESATAPDMRQAVARVADRIADNDVLAALKWTQTLPPSPGQEEAYQQVFSEWARKDPAASSQELVRMPPGRERDSAIHAFSRILVNENPEDAIVWATAITNPEMRLDTQIDVARQWNATSPTAAGPWIVANLPADAQAKALKPE